MTNATMTSRDGGATAPMTAYVYDPYSNDEDLIFETKDCSVWIRGDRLSANWSAST